MVIISGVPIFRIFTVLYDMISFCFHLGLHGPPMLVYKTNFGLVLYNHASFYRFDEPCSYWSVKLISVFLCFLLVNQRHISGIIVYNRIVTSIENTVQAVRIDRS